MTSSQTRSSASLDWGGSAAESELEVPHLVIAWSREQASRIGEAAPVEGPRVLGRGDRLPDDPAPRLEFFQQRPLERIRQPPLEGPRLSRAQLLITPIGDGRLEVKCIGRCPLFIDGVETSSGVAGPGAIVTLQNALILVVVLRRPSLCVVRAPACLQPFPFGSVDSHGFVGESEVAWSLRDTLAMTAQSSGHALISGESGVGKELAARAIHELSSRRAHAFIARNAATFPEGLVDSELFGTAKGYPNAGMPERGGLIAEADHGTFFLDEIGELPGPLQAHLLRVLDRDGEYQRLGESRVRRSNLRVVAATNRPVGALKHDFAARFTLRIEVPGLAMRREDIPLLLQHLVSGAARASSAIDERFFERRAGALAEPRIAPELIEALLRHRFTHHLRELERLMWVALSTSLESFIALTSQVSAALLDSVEAKREDAPEPVRELDPTGHAHQLGRAEIESALEQARGNVTVAARLLGLKNRFVLYRLLKRHGIARPDD
jgi:DNA-binding NtrC family response regulator